MTTIVINENTEEGRNLMGIIRAMRKSSDAVVTIIDDETDAFLNSLPSENIPGLPYTREERIASVRRGTEDILAGRTVTMETLRAKHPRI